MAPSGSVSRGSSRQSDAAASSVASAVPPSSFVQLTAPGPVLSLPVRFLTRVARPPAQVKVPWRQLAADKSGQDSAAMAPRDIVEAVYKLPAVKALHAQGGVVVQLRWRPFRAIDGHPKLAGREWRPCMVKNVLALPDEEDEDEDGDTAELRLLTNEVLPGETHPRDLDDDDEDDEEDEESVIVITTRQIAEVNGAIVLEDEDTDDALGCPMIHRYDAASGAFRALVSEAPFCQRRRASECDVTVAVESSAEQEQEQQVFRVRVRRYFTVHNLCHLLSRYYPLPSSSSSSSCTPKRRPKQQHALSLAFQGEPLVGDRRLASYGIGPGARLSLRLEPLAGSSENEDEKAGRGRRKQNNDNEDGGDDDDDGASSVASGSVATSSVAAELADPKARFAVRVRPAGRRWDQQQQQQQQQQELSLQVSPLDTVGAVIERFYQATATATATAPPRDAALLFAGARLDPMAVLYDYGVGANATLDFVGGDASPLRLTVTPIQASSSSGSDSSGSSSNEPLALCVLGTATVADVKERIRALLPLSLQLSMPRGAELRLVASAGLALDEGEEEEEWTAESSLDQDEEEEEEEVAAYEEEEKQEEKEEARRRERKTKTLVELGVRDGAQLTLLLPAAETSPYGPSSGERDACLATEGEEVTHVTITTMLDDGALLSKEVEVGASVSWPVFHAYATRTASALIATASGSDTDTRNHHIIEGLYDEVSDLRARRSELGRQVRELRRREVEGQRLIRYVQRRQRQRKQQQERGTEEASVVRKGGSVDGGLDPVAAALLLAREGSQ